MDAPRPEQQWFEDAAHDEDYLFELVSLAVGEAIVAGLERLNLTRAQLAARLGVSRPRVTQILAGDENLTLRTLVAIADALEADLTVSLVPRTAAAVARPARGVARRAG